MCTPFAGTRLAFGIADGATGGCTSAAWPGQIILVLTYPPWDFLGGPASRNVLHCAGVNKGHRLQAVTRNSSNEGLRHGVMVYVARMGKPCPEQRQQRQHSRASYRASNHDDHETATLDHAANAPKTLSTAYGSAGFARSTRRRLARFPIRRKPKPLQAIQAVSEAQRTEGQAGTDKPCAFRSMTANADG
jgi:hypothetical protein